MKNSIREISDYEVMQVSGGDVAGGITSIEYVPVQLTNAAANVVTAEANFINTVIQVAGYAVQNVAVSTTNP